MKKTNLSDYDPTAVPDGSNYHIGVIAAEWNSEVTDALLKGAVDTLLEHGVKEENLIVRRVPGTFELSSAADIMLDSQYPDAVICIGCVIQGETRHFEFIAQAVANGIAKVGIEYTVPVIFGVLTCNTAEQAADRSGGKHGNKGVEAAASCLQMLHTHKMMYSKK